MRDSRPRRRSVHFVPGGNDKFLGKALTSGADTLVFDLEDSVAPPDKPSAREAVVAWLHGDGDRVAGQEWMVRVNAVDTEWWRDDVAAVVAAGATALMVPKVSSLADYDLLDAEVRATDPESPVTFFPVATETPAAVFGLAEHVTHPRVDGICWGAEDLSAELGATANRGRDGRWLPVFETVRSLTVLAAAGAGVGAVDAVYTDLADLDGLRAESEESAAMGYTGRLTIHPSQIEVVNEVFSPTTAEIEEATELVAAFAEAEAEGRFAFRFRGRMVDRPHLLRARRLLERAAD